MAGLSGLGQDEADCVDSLFSSLIRFCGCKIKKDKRTSPKIGHAVDETENGLVSAESLILLVYLTGYIYAA